MGAVESRHAPQEKAKRVRTSRKKNNENKENNTNKNIKGSPQIQLKRIQDLVCDKTKDYNAMNVDDTVKLIKQVQCLSTPKKANA